MHLNAPITSHNDDDDDDVRVSTHCVFLDRPTVGNIKHLQLVRLIQLNHPECSFELLIFKQTRLRSRRFAAAQLPGRPGRHPLPLGGGIHHVGPEAHGARLSLVAVQRRTVQTLPEVSTFYHFTCFAVFSNSAVVVAAAAVAAV